MWDDNTDDEIIHEEPMSKVDDWIYLFFMIVFAPLLSLYLTKSFFSPIDFEKQISVTALTHVENSAYLRNVTDPAFRRGGHYDYFFQAKHEDGKTIWVNTPTTFGVKPGASLTIDVYNCDNYEGCKVYQYFPKIDPSRFTLPYVYPEMMTI